MSAQIEHRFIINYGNSHLCVASLSGHLRLASTHAFVSGGYQGRVEAPPGGLLTRVDGTFLSSYKNK